MFLPRLNFISVFRIPKSNIPRLRGYPARAQYDIKKLMFFLDTKNFKARMPPKIDEGTPALALGFRNPYLGISKNLNNRLEIFLK